MGSLGPKISERNELRDCLTGMFYLNVLVMRFTAKRGMMYDILALISDRSLLRMASSVCWHGREDR
jgi:hypothetical protein